MTQETVRAMADAEHSQVIACADIRSRAEKAKAGDYRQDQGIGGAVGVSITIGGTRGRPPKAKPDAKPAKKA